MVSKIRLRTSINSQGATYMHIPKGLIQDSSFPFNLDKDELEIRIDGKKLIIEKS